MSANQFRSWIKGLGKKFMNGPRARRGGRTAAPKSDATKTRLLLETLETRIVPATFTISSAVLPVNATAVVIQGTGIDPNPANDVVSFVNGAVSGTVYAATSTSLTVSLTNLSAISQNNALQVFGTVDGAYTTPFYTDVAVVGPKAPWIAPADTALLPSTTTLTIAGSDFDSNAAHDTVTFNGGVTGSVTSATTTALTVAVTGLSSLAEGTVLSASATVDSVSTGSPTPIGSVTPITPSTANLPDSSTTLTINGSGFSTTPASNSVSFNLGLVGTVTAATSSQLTVTITTPPTALGALTAAVTSKGITSPATQVATEVNGDFVVTDPSNNPGSFSDITLPYAVASALNGDTVSFASSLSGDTITLGSTLSIINSISIVGLGANELALTGSGAYQVVNVGSTATAVISGLNIEDGASIQGGNLYSGGTLTLFQDTVSNGEATSGAGIYNAGTMTIYETTVSGNGSDDVTAAFGAGVYNAGTMTIYGTTVTGNVSYSNGGGIQNTGTLTISNSTIADNQYYTYGGGIYNSGTLTLSNATIADNSAYETAAGVGDNGGGIYNTGTVTMANTIVDNNVGVNGGPDIYGTIASATNSIVGTNSGFTISSGTGNQLGVNPDLASTLANNGGPTQTIALQAGSPASFAGSALTTITGGQGGQGSSVGTTDTTIYVQNAAAIAQTPGDYIITIGTEELLVTNVNVAQNSLTVERGYNNTTPGTYAVGADVQFATDQRGVALLVPSIGAYGPPGELLTVTDPGSGPGSAHDVTLPYALGLAASMNGITIEFASSLSGDTITLTSTVPINNSISIEGLGAAALAIRGDGSSSVFSFGSSAATVNIAGLTIENGGGASGGGIYNAGTLTLADSIISSNTVTGKGGGIYSSGSLTLVDDNISGNAATGSGSGIFMDGNAALSISTDSASVTSTIGNNIALGGDGGVTLSGTGTIDISGNINLDTSGLTDASSGNDTISGVISGQVPTSTLPTELVPPVPGLQYELDASNASSLVTNSGGVSEWLDSSGNGNNFTAVAGSTPGSPSTVQEPGLVQNVFGDLPALQFYGENSPTELLGPGNVNAQTVIMVTQTTDVTSCCDGIWGAADPGQNEDLSLRLGGTYYDGPGNANDYNGTGSDAGGATGTTTITTAAAGDQNTFSFGSYGTPYIVTATGNLTPDAPPPGAGDLGSNVPTMGTMIGGGSYGSRYYDGYIGEVLVFNTLLTTSQTQEVLDYLSNEWLGTDLAVPAPWVAAPGSASLTSPSVLKSGSGTLTLSNVNTYVGATSVTGGTLNVSQNGAMGPSSAAGININGGTLALSGGFNYNDAEPLTIKGTGAGGVGAIENLSGNNTLSAPFTISTSATIGAAAGTTLTLPALSLAGGTTLTVVGAGAVNFTNSITATGSGSATLANTSGHTLAVSVPVNVTGAGTFNIAGSSAIDISGPINLGAQGNLGYSASANDTISGVISGTATSPTASINGLTMTGSGTLTLTEDNTYTGATYIDGGTLLVTQNGETGPTSAAGIFVNGGSLGLSGGFDYTDAEALSLSGTGANSAGALENISGDNTFGLPLTVAGTTTIGAAAGTLTLGEPVNLTANSTLTMFGAGTIDIPQNVTLATGIDTVNNDGSGSLNISGNISLSGTATFVLGGSGPINVIGSVVLGSGTFQDTTSGKDTISGVISGQAPPVAGAPLPPVPGLDYELDADASGSLVTNATGGVTKWLDDSGNGNNFSTSNIPAADQGPVASTDPQLVSNALNGLPALQFFGYNSPTELVGAPNVNVQTVFIVTSTNPFDSSEGCCEGIFGTAGSDVSVRFSPNGGSGDYSASNINGGTTSITTASGTTQTTVFSYGTVYIVEETGNITPSLTEIGGGSYGSRYYDGYIGELLAFNTVLTSAQNLEVTNYLSNQWLGTDLTVPQPWLSPTPPPSVLNSGTGTLILSNTNTYLGATRISGGTVVVSGNGALGASSAAGITVNGGTLGLSGGFNYSDIEPISISGSGANGAGALENISGNNTYSLPIGGSAPLTIGAAAGTLTVTSLSSLLSTTPLTVVGSGTVDLTSDITLGTGTVTVTDNGTGSLNIIGDISLPGATDFTLAGDGTINISGSVGLGALGSLTDSTSGTDTISGVVSGTSTSAPVAAGLPSIPGLQYDLDASDAASLTTTSSGGVTQWDDLSGNGYNFATTTPPGYTPVGIPAADNGPTASTDPQLVSNGINGLPALQFFGASNPTELVGAPDVNAQTIFIVTNTIAFNADCCNGILGWAGQDDSVRFSQNGSSGDWSASNIGGGTTYITTAAGTNQTSLFSYGTPYVLTETGNITPALTEIGGGSYGSRYYDGFIGQVLVYNTVLTSAQIQEVDDYLSAKWLGGTSQETGEVTMNGTGALVLANDNTYTGATVVDAGSVVVTNNNATGGSNAQGIYVNTGGSLGLAGGITYTNTELLSIAGNGANGNGAIENYSGNNTLAIPITLSANSASIGSRSGILTIADPISGGPTTSLILDGAGTTDIAAGASVTVGSGGLILLGSGDFNIAGPVNLGSQGGVFAELSGQATITGLITGTSTSTEMVMAGSGTLTLSNDNDYTGLTTINSGTLVVTENGAMGPASAAGIVITGGSLGFADNVDYTSKEPITISGAGALVNISGDNTFSSPFTIDGFTTIGSIAGSLSIDTAINAGAFNLVLNASGSLTINDTITLGGGDLTLSGSGTISIPASISLGSGVLSDTSSGQNTISGVISSGPPPVYLAPPFTGLEFELDAADDSSLVTNATGGVTQWNDLSGNGNNFTSPALTSDNGGGPYTNTAPQLVPDVFGDLPGLEFFGPNEPTELVGAPNVNAQTVFIVTMTEPGNSGDGGIFGTAGADDSLRLASDTAYYGTGAGANGNDFNETGGANGTTYITTTSSFDDNTTSFGSTGVPYIVEATGNLTSALTEIGGGSYGDRYYDGYIGEVLVFNTVLTTAERQDVEDYLSNQWLGTDLSVPDPWVAAPGTPPEVGMTGTGTLTLANTNTYLGDTSVSNGTLNVTANEAMGPAASGATVTVASGGALTFTGGVDYSAAEAISIAGVGPAGNGAIENISGSSTYAGPITLTGAATIGSDAGNLNLTNAILNIGTNDLTTVGAGTITIPAAIQGASGSVTVGSTGTVTLSNSANTYTGPTTVNAGTLLLTGSLPDTSSVTVNSGATLAGTGSFTAAAIVAGGVVNPGSPAGGTGTLSVGSATFSSNGNLTADISSSTSSSLLKVANSLTLGGTSTLTLDLAGLTSVPSGPITIAADGSQTGEFAGLYVFDNPNDYQVAVNYTATAVTVTITSTSHPTATIEADTGTNPSGFGANATFTVTVTSSSPISGETVSIEDASNGDAVVATPTLTNGTATFSISSLSVGSHNLFAVYTTDGTYGTSYSNVVTQVVVPAPPGLAVTSVTATPSGFVLLFNEPIDPKSLVLYSSPGDTTLGAADISIVGATTGTLRGSVIIDPTNPDELTFVQTSGLLAPDTYTVGVTTKVTSDGTGMSSNYSTTFSVASTSTPVLSVPSFARGPGQTVALTDTVGNDTGIPVNISNATGVTQVSFSLTYDPQLLTIAGSGALSLSSAASLAGLVIQSYTITPVDANHSILTVSISGGTGFTATIATSLVTILASVPTTAPYLDKEVLNLSSVQVNGASATGVSSVAVVAYPGDVLGTGLPNATDASLVDQVASGSGTGFSVFKDLDPAIIGGVGGGLLLNANDASLIDEAASGATVAQIPSIPVGVSLTFGGPDPYLYLSAVQGAPGQTVTETLYLDVTDPNGIQLTALDEAIGFDVGALQISDVRGTSALMALGSYDTASTVDNGSGEFLVAQAFMGTGLPPVIPYGTDIPVLEFNVTLNADMSVGSESGLTLLQYGTVNNVTQYTAISDNEGALSWTPGKAPSNSGNTAIDGSVMAIASPAPAVVETAETSQASSVAVTSRAIEPVRRVIPVSSTEVGRTGSVDVLSGGQAAPLIALEAATPAVEMPFATVISLASSSVAFVQPDVGVVSVPVSASAGVTSEFVQITSVAPTTTRSLDSGAALSLAVQGVNKAASVAPTVTSNAKVSTSVLDELYRQLGSLMSAPSVTGYNLGLTGEDTSDELSTLWDLDGLLADNSEE